MWTWKPNHAKTCFNAFFLTMFFIGMYGELRNGGVGDSTLFFIMVFWLLIEEPPADWREIHVEKS